MLIDIDTLSGELSKADAFSANAVYLSVAGVAACEAAGLDPWPEGAGTHGLSSLSTSSPRRR
jgi:hypothetical protein